MGIDSGSKRASAARPLVVVAGPLTGPRAAYGAWIRQCVSQAAVDSALELVLMDDRAEPADAADVARAAVAAGAAAVVGHFNSDCARAATPIYAHAGIPLLLPASTAAGLPDGRTVFRLCADETAQAAALFDSWRRNWPEHVLQVWHDGSAYGQRLHAHLRVVAGRALEASDTSTRTTRARVVIYLGTHIAVLRRMKEEEGPHAPAVALCCDDCDIEEFDRHARTDTWVCAPHADYGQLLLEALRIIEDRLVHGHLDWSRDFDAAGQSRHAAWRLRRLRTSQTSP